MQANSRTEMDNKTYFNIMFGTKRKIKKLNKKVKHLTKVVEANNEFLAQIYEVMHAVAAEGNEGEKESDAPTPIGFPIGGTKTNKDD